MRDATLIVFGASGLVGSALCERLFFTEEWKFVPVLHTSGNAARLARLAIGDKVAYADLLDPDSLNPLLSDDVILINCARGGDSEMRRGFSNLLRAAQKRRVRKFIHISSLAIYGEDPPEESTDPACSSFRMLTEYGRTKRWQDEKVFELHRRGVPSYILCPGNITGPYSPWSALFAQRLLAGPFPLVDEGHSPSNLTFVDNLVEALLAAASAQGGAGERYFVNEPTPISWKKYCTDMGALLNVSPLWVPFSREEVLGGMRTSQRRNGLSEHLRVALSGEFRAALSMLPSFAWLNRKTFETFQSLPVRWQRAVRRKLGPSRRIESPKVRPEAAESWARLQVRRWYHSPETLAKQLAWKPVVTYERGLDLTGQWLQFIGLCTVSDGSLARQE